LRQGASRIAAAVRTRLARARRPPDVELEPLPVFLSSLMGSDMVQLRDAAERGIIRSGFARPWLFERRPPSGSDPEQFYLEAVERCALLICLLGSTIRQPVKKEIFEALRLGKDLIAIILEVPERSDEAKEVILEIQDQSVTREVPCTPKEVERQVLLAIQQHAVNCILRRNRPSRIALLRYMRNDSRARAVRRWHGAGIETAAAEALESDAAVGAAPREVMEHIVASRLAVIVGPVGCGKSLCAERYLQQAIADAASDADAPIPVYLRFRSIVGALQDNVLGMAGRLGQPLAQGVCVVVDGVEETPFRTVDQTIDEARDLVQSIPKSSILIATRPSAAVEGIPEAVSLPPLSDTAIAELHFRVFGRALTYPQLVHALPDSLRAAVRLPLFCIFLANYRRRNNGRTPASESQLIEAAVVTSLGQTELDRLSADQLLEELARHCLDLGTFQIPWRVLTNERARILELKRTSLVVEEGQMVGFSLQIFTEWFGARYLGRHSIEEAASVVEDPRKADSWRYSLQVYAANLEAVELRSFIDLVIHRDPIFADRLLRGVAV
jgi:hypothetical protein